MNNNRIKSSLFFFSFFEIKSIDNQRIDCSSTASCSFNCSFFLYLLVGYHTTTTPSSTSSSTSSTNAGGGSRIKNDYDNTSGRGNDCNSNPGHQQQAQQSSSWSSLVKSESPHGLRGLQQHKFISSIRIFSLDPYSTFSSQSFFPHNAHRFSGGAAGK